MSLLPYTLRDSFLLQLSPYMVILFLTSYHNVGIAGTGKCDDGIA
jgi:hypothetical protein